MISDGGEASQLVPSCTWLTTLQASHATGNFRRMRKNPALDGLHKKHKRTAEESTEEILRMAALCRQLQAGAVDEIGASDSKSGVPLSCPIFVLLPSSRSDTYTFLLFFSHGTALVPLPGRARVAESSGRHGTCDQYREVRIVRLKGLHSVLCFLGRVHLRL